MARKRTKAPQHVNHDRWLVSYADFITLLFAFFVVMFAVSQVDTKKMGRFTQSFHNALEWQVMEQRSGRSSSGKDVIEVIPGYSNAKAAKGARSFEQTRDAIRRGLAQRLGSARMLAGLNILEVHGELVLRLPEKLMFDRGEAFLRTEGGEALVAIAEELAERPVRIRVEGHTDSTPIRTPRFPSNWELSQSRAMAVVRFFLEDGKISPARLAAAGYGEYHPIATNETVDGKAQNRRVDLIVVADLEGGVDGSEAADKAPSGKSETDTTPAQERQNTGDPATLSGQGAETTQ